MRRLAVFTVTPALAAAGVVAGLIFWPASGTAGTAGTVARPAAGGQVSGTASSQAASAPATQPAPVPAASCKGQKVGVASNNLAMFEAATQIYPSVSAKYFRWGSPFPVVLAQESHVLGAKLQIVLEPRNVSLQKIADGGYDSYLARWAAADRISGLPVILSFAPEANGKWYSWGKGHVSPAVYRAAWRHVHHVLYRDGARKITWMWQVNVSFPAAEPLRELWPGASYVNEVGIDGHLRSGNTFDSVFLPTIRQLRAITSKPVVIAELADNRGKYRVRQVNELFSALCTQRLARFVWFDVDVKGDHLELEGDAAAIAAFRKDAAKIGDGVRPPA